MIPLPNVGGPFIILGRRVLRAILENPPEGRKVEQEKVAQGLVWLRSLPIEYY